MDVCDTCIVFISSPANRLMVVDLGGFYKDLSRTVGSEDYYRRLTPGTMFRPISFDLPKKEENIGKTSSEQNSSEFEAAPRSIKKSTIEGICGHAVQLLLHSLQLSGK